MRKLTLHCVNFFKIDVIFVELNVMKRSYFHSWIWQKQARTCFIYKYFLNLIYYITLNIKIMYEISAVHVENSGVFRIS